MFPDCGRDWPLWENTTDEHDYGYTMSPSDYGLSPELTDRIATWHRMWLDDVDSGTVLASEEAVEEWERMGEDIVRDLRTEVYWIADVVYEVGRSAKDWKRRR